MSVLRGILAVVVGLLTFPVYMAFVACVILALPFLLLAIVGTHVVHGLTGYWLINPKWFQELVPNYD